MLIIISLSVLLLVFNLVLYFSLFGLFRKKSSEDESIKFSIVISAKNESRNIPDLYRSLRELDYPKKNFEIIFIDDDSEDNTFQIFNSELKSNSEDNSIATPILIKAADKIFPGKKGALALGIERASNQNIIITDADCIPDKNWLKAFSSKFKEGYEILFGIAPFYQKSTFTNNISCFENLRSSILTFSLTGIGLPYSAAARSFAFTKKAYEKVNGYKNTLETLSGDDDLFIREAVKKNLQIGVVTNTFVFSSTKTKLPDYFNQKARHTSTSNYYLLKHKAILAFWHLINIVSLLSLLLMVFNSKFVILFASKLIFDIAVTSIFQKKFSYNFDLIKLIYLQIFYELFLIVHFFRSFFVKNKW